MMFYLNLFSIVLAVSLDGFGVGMMYGMRKIKLTIPALLIIMLCSGSIVFLSMTIGNLIRVMVSPSVTSILGSVILIILGLIVLGSNIKEKLNVQFPKTKRLQIWSRFTAILSNPHQADKDESGIISGGEAILLGIALAMDAFGAGFAAAMLGYSPFVISVLVAIMSGLFLFSGLRLGLLLAKWKAMENLTYLPPFILIGIAASNLIS